MLNISLSEIALILLISLLVLDEQEIFQVLRKIQFIACQLKHIVQNWQQRLRF